MWVINSQTTWNVQGPRTVGSLESGSSTGLHSVRERPFVNNDLRSRS